MVELTVIYGRDKKSQDHQLRPLNHNNKEVKVYLQDLLKSNHHWKSA